MTRVMLICSMPTATEDEDQQIGQQDTEREGADGSFWRPAFSSETDGKMSDEHLLYLIAPW